MTRINLLPWREERRVRQQRNFYIMIGMAVIFAGLGVLLAHLYVATLIEHQEARNNFLKKEITRLKRVEKEIREMERSEASLRARLGAIQDLQRTRPDIVRALDELVRRLPEEVYLSSVQSSGRLLTLKGTARVNNVVSDLMRELDKSDLYNAPTLRVVENKEVIKSVVASKFELIVNRRNLHQTEDDGGSVQ